MKMKKIAIGETTYKSSGKWIEIKYNNSGSPYFMNNGLRAKLDDYLNTNGTWTNMTEHFNAGLHAYDGTNNYKPDFITISSTGESVMIWRQVL